MTARPVRVVVESDRGYAFPLDMLRYDSLVPATEMDSALVETWLQGRVPAVRTVTLTGPHGATVGRWESFGWRVVEGARK